MSLTNTGYSAYYEAKRGIKVEQNQEFIIENRNPTYAFYFARDVKNANVQKLSEVILNSGDRFWIEEFYKDIPHDKFDVEKFETFLTFM